MPPKGTTFYLELRLSDLQKTMQSNKPITKNNFQNASPTFSVFRAENFLVKIKKYIYF